MRTSEGDVIPYDKLVLTSGPWTNRVLSSASLRQLPLVVSNEQQLYVRPREEPVVNNDTKRDGTKEKEGDAAANVDQGECVGKEWEWDQLPLIIGNGELSHRVGPVSL